MLIRAEDDRIELVLSRRAFLRLGAAAAGAAVFGRLAGVPGGSPAAAAAAPVSDLNLLFAGGTWKEYFERIYARPFEKAKGARVVFSVGDSAQQISRVIAERDNQRFDMIHIHQYAAAQLNELGLLVPPDPRTVTNLKDVDEAFRFPYFVGKVLAPFGLAVNTRRAPKKVTSWKDLWDPAFTGRVAIPKWEWVGNTWFYAVNRVWGGTETNIDPGIAKCRELVRTNRAVIMNNVEHGIALLTSEETWIQPFYTARTEQARDAGAPVEFVFPSEGGLNWTFNLGIIRGRSPASTALAQEFLNFTLDPVQQAQFGILTGYPPTNRRAQALLPRNSNVLLTPEQMANLGRMRFDIKAMLANRDRHAERWNKEVLG
ncbi:MAG: extracellular solute-binding protein [Armatimonadota bacterium]|nr:extracellular solute-binding protein [Armatimonadota bacterium]MDR7451846.1 extracellular solute-binding protein [Armatimonadota bacterium]MDR7467571.1 extracellular solute-binding protein [Armatimonadota bacterium]MDR7494468.1 extracellular solute-binding protein [Armatimonadota bacterium]MDR7499729.1 extracellular solute-binding protein [Armatimonadota bacterium]